LRTVLEGPVEPAIADIEYSALISTLFVTDQRVARDFYWMSLLSDDTTAGGLFNLSNLNPGIGGLGETCFNFVSHLRSPSSELFLRSEEELAQLYRRDFATIFGFELEEKWYRCFKIPTYSPVFTREYANPPEQSDLWGNLFLCGNFRTFPSVASTGTALQSGLDTAERALRFAQQTQSDRSNQAAPGEDRLRDIV
jgi:hypothetical protein